MSTTYVRVTITGERRNGEMLLPTDRQVAELMPEILQTCGSAGHDRTPQALTLTPLGSATLRPHQTLEEAGVENGAVLSLEGLMQIEVTGGVRWFRPPVLRPGSVGSPRTRSGSACRVLSVSSFGGK